MDSDYQLVGYFRFITPDEGAGVQGVVGKVIGVSASGWADQSDVPIYRRNGQTKADLDELTLA